jgi:hypothetical protein
MKGTSSKMATNPNATNSVWTPHDAPAQVSTEPHVLTENMDVLVSNLEGKGEAELRNLYAVAQHEESNAKQDLYMLRQRVANLGTDINTNEEILLGAAKRRVAEGLAQLKAIESKFGGPPSTPTTVPPTAPVATVPVEVQDTVPDTTKTK